RPRQHPVTRTRGAPAARASARPTSGPHASVSPARRATSVSSVEASPGPYSSSPPPLSTAHAAAATSGRGVVPPPRAPRARHSPQQASARRAADALTREGGRGRCHDTPLAGRPAWAPGQRGDTGPPAGEEPDAEDAGHDVPSSTSAALQPPKPSEVLRLTRGRAARATPRTSTSHAGSASS